MHSFRDRKPSASLGKCCFVLFLLFLSGYFFVYSADNTRDTIFQFDADDIDGHRRSLRNFRDKVVLISNVASGWGSTNVSYTQFQQLYEKYNEHGFEILAFPCNQFGNQEPKSNEEIKSFVGNYKVTFHMFSKIDVNGPMEHSLFTFLKKGVDVHWNFEKFLCDSTGRLHKRYLTAVAPLTIETEIIELIKRRDGTIQINEQLENPTLDLVDGQK